MRSAFAIVESPSSSESSGSPKKEMLAPTVQSSSETAVAKKKRALRIPARLLSTVRFLLLDAPLILVLLSYAAVKTLHQCNLEYFEPQVTDLLVWRGEKMRQRDELTYCE